MHFSSKQRFGSGSVPTYLVGAALLRGEWRAAVNMILDPREGDILLNGYFNLRSMTGSISYGLKLMGLALYLAYLKS